MFVHKTTLGSSHHGRLIPRPPSGRYFGMGEYHPVCDDYYDEWDNWYNKKYGLIGNGGTGGEYYGGTSQYHQ